ncbi:MAG: hypothetical protein AAF587_26790 [Bacteroidota bacterium]
MRRFGLLFSLGTLLLGACRIQPIPPPNPFDQYKDLGLDTVDVISSSLDPNSIEGLHNQIFAPTCANSGCHDGTFEPDFRTIESTYNTLVYQPVIKNDPTESFLYRVQPGNVEQSVLWNRLTVDIDGQSGIMPLVDDPNSEWEAQKEIHLEHIKNWIEAGAPDMFGNLPLVENLPPFIQGVIGLVEGRGNPLERDGGNGALLIPKSAHQVDLWVSIGDDQTSPMDISFSKVRLSEEIDDFEFAPSLPLDRIAPILEQGFTGEIVSYYHKITIYPREYQAGKVMFLRIFLQEPGQNDLTEIPRDGSAHYIKDLFSIKFY